MRVVIMGGGKVGSFLTEILEANGHRVTVIERDRALCESIASRTSATVIEGDGCDMRFQEEADVGSADVFAAVTGDDDDNLVACQLARTHFQVPRAVARVNNPKNEKIFNRLGIDAISSTTVIAELIEERTTVGDIITLHTLKKGRLAVVELDLPEDRCRSCNVPLRDLGLPQGCVLVSIIRGDEVIIPQGESVLQPGDTVIAVTEPEREAELKRILAG
ncbi:NAD-binding protein [Candidatus Solincola tengchongensis]|uniref:potassium channel family protein n=1 Tax=Candidatus Solincola tengchongensis TaxID=2900693 RepID=UPI00257D9FF5